MKTRKILSIALVLVMVLSSLSVFATGAFAAADKWDGKTANIKWFTKDPSAAEYTITTAADFVGLSVLTYIRERASSVKDDNKAYYDADGNVIFDATKIAVDTPSVGYQTFLGKTVKLAGDIDLAGKAIVPIGANGSFQGMFDGQNHTISNFVINSEGANHYSPNYTGKQAYYGLFAFVAKDGAGVKNLKIVNEVLDIKIASSTQKIWAGGITGTTLNNIALSNITIEGLTINFTIDGTAPTALEIYLGAGAGVYKSTLAADKLVITDYSVNGDDDVRAALAGGTLTFATDAPICGKNTSTGTFTNSSVTEGVYTPAGDNNQGGNNNQGNTNPDTGDFTTVAIAAVAMLSLAGAAVVISKKRTNR